MKNVIAPAIYKLYKENIFAKKFKNAEEIMKMVSNKYKQSMILKFKVFDLK